MFLSHLCRPDDYASILSRDPAPLALEPVPRNGYGAASAQLNDPAKYSLRLHLISPTHIVLKHIYSYIGAFSYTLEATALENLGRRGRPRGFDKEKYWRVLFTLLDGPQCFNEVVERSGLSRRFVSKVLKHALLRDFVGVNYNGHKALYFLKCDCIAEPPANFVIDGERSEAHIIEEPTSLFHQWWSLGLPHHDDFHEVLADETFWINWGTKLKLADFLYEKYPRHVVSDPRFWLSEGVLTSKTGEGEVVTFKRLYEIFVPSRRRLKTVLEDVVLTRIVDALVDRTLCPRCFRRGKFTLLDKEDGLYRCRDRRCGASFKKPWRHSKIYDEFEEWRRKANSRRNYNRWVRPRKNRQPFTCEL